MSICPGDIAGGVCGLLLNVTGDVSLGGTDVTCDVQCLSDVTSDVTCGVMMSLVTSQGG